MVGQTVPDGYYHVSEVKFSGKFMWINHLSNISAEFRSHSRHVARHADA